MHRHRYALWALLGLLGGVGAAGSSSSGDRLLAGQKPTPARPVQVAPRGVEPPLADGPKGPPMPPGRPPAPLVPQPAVPLVPHPAGPHFLPPVPGTPCPCDPPTPMVAISVRVPATAQAGEDIEYKICVENCRKVPAHHVIVKNLVPPNARFVWAKPKPAVLEPELQWHLGTLEGCGCREITLVLAPTGLDDIKNCVRVQFEHGQCVCTQIARPALTIRKCGPTDAVLYDPLTYQIEVRNCGAAPATGVTLIDNLPEGLQHSSGKAQLTWDLGTLAPGQCRCVEYQVVALKAGRHCNRAEVTANGALRQQAESCVNVAEAQITVRKTGPAQSYTNLPAAYHITVTNPGNAAITNVTVTDPLPAQTTFVAASHGGQLVGDTVRWSLGNIEPGGSRTVQLVLRANASGRICNKAVVAADRGLTGESEFCTDFVGVSALLLKIDDTGSDPLEIGAEGRYLVTVKNTGNEAATKVQVLAVLPDQMAFTRAAGPAFKQDGQRLLFEPITLQPGAEAVYDIRGKALRAGDVRFKVDLTADQLTSGPVRAEESTTFYNPETAPPAPAAPAAPPPAAPAPGEPPVAPPPPPPQLQNPEGVPQARRRP